MISIQNLKFRPPAVITSMCVCRVISGIPLVSEGIKRGLLKL